MKTSFWYIEGLTLLLLVTGCAPKKQMAKDMAKDPAPLEEEASLRDKEFVPVPQLGRVHFDVDSTVLSSASRKTLAENARWLQANKRVELRIEGHCDERGTTEYNLSLGQRRASAIRDYYKTMGIPRKRMATISFGKERPVCEEADESCWHRNRRGETLVKRGTQTAKTGPSGVGQ